MKDVSPDEKKIYMGGVVFFFYWKPWHSTGEKYNLNPHGTAPFFIYFQIPDFNTNYFQKCVGVGICGFVMQQSMLSVLKKEDFRHLYMFAHYKIIPTILNEPNYNLACRDYNE